jgi:preprotein translocase subunit SecA
VDGKVQIVDEFTGRTMADRSWERGLHQLIEVKEGLQTTGRRETIARITYQRFFRRYLQLAGMTGTAAEVASELRSVYGLNTVRVPTNRPLARHAMGERFFISSARRWSVVVQRIVRMRALGRPVLVGTRSVQASEHLSTLLAQGGIEHALLNARQDAKEAEIVAQAGHPQRVTVATNMAGRGTDIILHPDVRAAGGLHVILTEFHESRRIDRQLFGRAGRQGDPGSFESLVSLDDELFQAHAGPLVRWVRARFREEGELPRLLGGALRILAQQSAERLHARERTRTLESEKFVDRSLAFTGPGE